MTQDEKTLLLNDLCARLPYEVQCEIGGLKYGPYTFIGSDVEDLFSGRLFKPYLRPMSSMTEEELKEFRAFHCLYDWHPEFYVQMCNLPNTINMINWLNKKQFDYRGLIPMGLALEAPEDMYK